MNETVTTLSDVETDLSITEGRVGMCVDREQATVRLLAPTHERLSRREPALAIEVTGPGFNGAVRFDAVDLERLVHALDDLVEDEVVAP